jgi:hypothetical protein
MLAGIVIWLRAQKGTKFADFLQTPGILILLFSLVYTGIHIISWALVRYRLPVDALLVLYAGVTIQAVINWLESRKTPSKQALSA